MTLKYISTNEFNIDNSLKKLDNFEIIEFNEIQRGDIITCFNLQKFFDLKLYDYFKVTNVLTARNQIKGLSIYNNKISIYFNKKNIYFREFDQEQLLKFRLLKYVN